MSTNDRNSSSSEDSAIDNAINDPIYDAIDDPVYNAIYNPINNTLHNAFHNTFHDAFHNSVHYAIYHAIYYTIHGNLQVLMLINRALLTSPPDPFNDSKHHYYKLSRPSADLWYPYHDHPDFELLARNTYF
ncbi:hypothetical protein Slin14017_G128010 [Septoria linicola]|nr:hypothetical protein Slin14017_G128010 [Septoria linicola]